MARRLLLVRHAAPPPEYTGRYLGSTDVPLGSEGLVQAENLAAAIAARGAGKCFSSPYARALATAQAAAGAAKLPVQVDPDLREIDFGQWECKTFADISRDCPQAIEHWSRLAADFAFPGGESIADFQARVRRAAQRLADDPAETVLAVAHGGVVRAMICHFLGLRLENYVLFHIRYTTIATLDLFDGKGVLAGLEQPAPPKEGPCPA